MKINIKENKYEDPYKVPHPITKVGTNGTFIITWGSMKEHIIIIWVKSHHK